MPVFQPSLHPHTQNRVYVIVWESNPEVYTRGLVYDIEHCYEQPLVEARHIVTQAISGLNVNLKSKSWYSVSEADPKLIEKGDQGTIGNTRFILISNSQKLQAHMSAGSILCNRLFESYFPNDARPW
ncbi:hypothetical protein GGI19_004269 [Coemansia pectinata]|uniref:Uncharacterized protein n=1 Tax=Coemansia pectinata TaxID=1052879 RepID=A0A9W8L8J9_9FUNG|nr:hypothetical protein GGI19_004269 [Coemansia pectinata]